MKMNKDQLVKMQTLFDKLKNFEGGFYQRKFEQFSELNSWEDFENLPFTNKEELRDEYPLGIAAVEQKDIVRIHSSSGTTGTPIIIPYTKKDVDDWATIFARCYSLAGITNEDVIQITPGYGLWTAGIGFQAGAEKLGSMVVPMGPGNTDKQIKMMMDLKSTVFCATSSYALLLAEEIEERGVRDRLHLKKAVIGSERWGEKMRRRIANELGVELYDIYGLTEIYGPGVAMSCKYETGMHYWDDYVYFEIIDPKTGKVLPDGEIGELVITTLVKEGAPLIRYRTHDLTRIISDDCPCGCKHPRIDTLIGRSDDMVKVKGVNIYPGQIEDVLKIVEGVSSEYQVMIDHLDGRDIMTLYFEMNKGHKAIGVEKEVQSTFKEKVGLTIIAKAVEIGDLPRSERKSRRIFDNRY